MLLWLEANIVSIAITIVLVLLVALIIRSLVLDKKAGKHLCGGSCGACACSGACGGGCKGCPMQGKCHGPRS